MTVPTEGSTSATRQAAAPTSLAAEQERAQRYPSPGPAVLSAAPQVVEFYHAETCTFRILGGWIPKIAKNVLKYPIGRHLYQDAEHADWLRRRLSELRLPPSCFGEPRPELKAFFIALDRSPDIVCFLSAVYGVLRPRLLEAYRAYLQEVHLIYDEPTTRVLRRIVPEEETLIVWGQQMVEQELAALDDPGRAQVAAWQQHVSALLDQAGGFRGDPDVLRRREEVIAQRRYTESPLMAFDFEPIFFSRRDPGFVIEMPKPKPPAPAAAGPAADPEAARSQQGGEAAKPAPPANPFLDFTFRQKFFHDGILVELPAMEIMGRNLYEFNQMPWQFYLDMARQVWDEARHAEILEEHMEVLGGKMGMYPLGPIGSYERIYPWTLVERLWLFNRQGEGGAIVDRMTRRVEHLAAAGDERGATLYDYVLADETQHVLFGNRYVRFLLSGGATGIPAAGTTGEGAPPEVDARMRELGRRITALSGAYADALRDELLADPQAWHDWDEAKLRAMAERAMAKATAVVEGQPRPFEPHRQLVDVPPPPEGATNKAIQYTPKDPINLATTFLALYSVQEVEEFLHDAEGRNVVF